MSYTKKASWKKNDLRKRKRKRKKIDNKLINFLRLRYHDKESFVYKKKYRERKKKKNNKRAINFDALNISWRKKAT